MNGSNSTMAPLPAPEMASVGVPSEASQGISRGDECRLYPKATLGEYIENMAKAEIDYAHEGTADQGSVAPPDLGGIPGLDDRGAGESVEGQETGGSVPPAVREAGATTEASAGPAPELSTQVNFPRPGPHDGSCVISNWEVGTTGVVSAGKLPRNSSNGANFVTPIPPIRASLHSLRDEKWGRDSFGNKIRRDFAVELKSLTADEARYLSNFRDVDALRGAIAKARLGRENRLRAKVLEQEVGCELTRSSSSASVSGSGRHRPTIEGSATGATSKPAIDILGSVTQQRPRYGRPQEGCLDV